MKGSDFHRVEKAIRFLTENAERQPSLEALAHYLGMSEFHCHRLFTKWAGVTPKDFLQFVTLVHAKSFLASSNSILDASLETGLSSPSRLHDLFIHLEAMTPGEYKRGAKDLTIRWAIFESPLGSMTLAATERGICSLNFGEPEGQAQRRLKTNWPYALLMKDPKGLLAFADEIRSRMRKGSKSGLRLCLKGTPFQVKVWEALLRIPEGSVTTYQAIARGIGMPQAARAVGTAVGANPVGYLIPCHRVIKSTGALGEYRWGAARKAALLAIEGAKVTSTLGRTS